ncbi:ubiquitin carboxyl-terminal hydrolase [Trypanosoma grayi]|uniref:ubiquitin carboxyl-terminal hydrolase n=1 Tax=Trypanosoma grayi TaxID=71804 RepID=UPI0004F4998E|nr:ubiquitin carboxyl-terminal hydrolase [Trypanosoma grayi]KEG13409.1 ubiquitin carboxyl-terminal hydrolase [Trypanosoma grayi]
MPKEWFPLESNPDVLNGYLKKFGLLNPKVQFCDVFSLESELFAMVPRPIRAMILLHPITREGELYDKMLAMNQTTEAKEFMEKNEFFFSKQTIGNACGTMAILHALLNNLDYLGEVEKDSPFEILLNRFKDAEGQKTTTERRETTPERLAKLIESDDLLDRVHRMASTEGVTENQSIDADIDLHFVCFVRVNGRCVELDGRKPFPLLHGACTDDESFANAAAEAIRLKMKQDPESLRFNIIALSEIRN